MAPKEFPEQNVIFAKDQPEYNPLPAFRDEKGDVVTCWELSDEEIERLIQTKTIYQAVKTFNNPLQPVFITTEIQEVLIK